MGEGQGKREWGQAAGYQLSSGSTCSSVGRSRFPVVRARVRVSFGVRCMVLLTVRDWWGQPRPVKSVEGDGT